VDTSDRVARVTSIHQTERRRRYAKPASSDGSGAVDRLHELKGFESTDFTIFHKTGSTMPKLAPPRQQHSLPGSWTLTNFPRLAHRYSEFSREFAFSKFLLPRNRRVCICEPQHRGNLATDATASLEGIWSGIFHQAVDSTEPDDEDCAPVCQRIFCDLFAVRLIGHATPSLTLSYSTT